MALKDKELDSIRGHLDDCSKPLFYFDDDVDGLCSFLLLYRYKREGKGIILKVAPEVKKEMARKAVEFGADKVFILDKPMVSDEFFDEIKADIVWLDHHEVQDISHSNVHYFNPRKHEDSDNRPTTYWCYKVVDPKLEDKNNLWIAAVGCVGDWHLPDFFDRFREVFPELVGEDVKKPEDAYFASRLGELIRILSYILKGQTTEVFKCIKILTRIESPVEILDQATDRGRFIYKKYLKEKEEYDSIMREIVEKHGPGDKKKGMIVHIYHANKTSFTSDLSNELLYMFPERIILVGREKNEEIKLSLRSSKEHDLREALESALTVAEGYGGGHRNACGANVKKRDFSQFVEKLRGELGV
ncbi:DHH family phosphoesterase [Candidatus Woesearchaeota archaeon]|nr:DHH family phosphoesterase [Candidatus Woesearchaeota archaeon]